MVKLIGLLLATLPFEFWPGATYDARVPTFRHVLGYDPGDRITSDDGILRYLDALAVASGRLKVFEYGESWEGRKLVYAAIGSESNIRRLDEIRSAIERLADPRKTSEAEARRLMAGLPVVVWLGYGVHGNEISSPDAALVTAYHLLAARNDQMVDQILENDLVLIDPIQNPDGRQRFLHYFEQTIGLEPDASPLAAEHNEPWPSGRTNHYLFDLNRDWFALTQPETRGRIQALRQWYPLVFVDLHEMGSENTYYFSPEADPFNPHLVKYQRDDLKWFGQNNARYFDHFGFDYFTREVYDAFYPGYGSSWPEYYGSVAMTYEQASVRGLVIRKRDDGVAHFRDTVRRHFVASLATAEAAAQHREGLLNDFYQYRASAIAEGAKEPVRAYILPRGRDASTTDKLAGLLMEQGVEVERATAPFRAASREYAEGTYVVSLAQPGKRLIRTLLDKVTPLDEAFVKQEEIRRQRKLSGEIYDVTAWSLPLMFNVEAIPSAAPVAGDFEPAKPVRILPGEIQGGTAEVAYLAAWGSSAAGRLLAAALREDLQVFSSDKPFALNGARFPAGSLIFKVNGNPPDLRDRLARLAASTGADLYATNTGWVDEGVNFGSSHVLRVRKPRIALAWDEPVYSMSAGAARFVLERQYGYPVTPIRVAQLAEADLSRFQVLILAAGGNYARAFGESGAEHLKAWVESGGTLIALADAVGFLANPKTELLAVEQEDAVREGEPAKKPEKEDSRVPGKIIASQADYTKAIEAEKELPDSIPGALLRARVDPDHWLGAGVGESVIAMVVGRDVFTPVKLDKGVNVAVFESADKVLASGYLWEEGRKQLAYKPLVIAQPQGRGMVVAFTADPNYRGYLDGMNILFLNAVFRGPAHVRPVGSEDGE